MANLADKIALVTDASRGMGRATALALAAAGARVIVHYGRYADEANAVVDQIRTAHGRADAVPADLAAPDGPHALAARVRNLIGARLDIIVSNAGISNATREYDGEAIRRPVRRQCPRNLFSRSRFRAAAATSCLCHRWERAPRSARCRLTRAQRAP
jgi:NAD(P)-dependent dehydrogenase (short-subunit alcohol dehydrogenase family)